MADISRLSRILNGAVRGVDLSANTLVLSSVKIGAGQTELTQTILDKLITMQGVADADGTYDSRYYTESEISDSTASSGSDLVGDDNTYSNFTPAAATVKGALSGIDSALTTAGNDEKVGVSADDTTPSYLEDKIVVSDGSNTTNILETSTLNAAGDEDFQIQIDQSKIDHGSLTGLADDDHTQYIRVDGTRAFTGDQSMGGNKLTNLAAPTADTDAATKSYVDAIKQGLDVKDSVRAATESNIADLAAGAPNTVDGVSLSAGDRILVKSQSTGSENGIYVVDTVGTGADGSWSRAADADEDAEVTAGLFTFVEEGTANADSGWILTTDDPITVGTTSLTFAQFSGAGQITAGDGLTKSGNTLDVNAGDGIQIVTDAVAVDLQTSGGLKIVTGQLGIEPSDFAGNGLADDGSDNLTLDINGITSSATAKDDADLLAIYDNSNAGLRKQTRANFLGADLQEAETFFASTDLSASEAETLSDGSNADSLHEHALLAEEFTAGEAMAANTTFLVRMAVDGETAGRVYKADKDASTSDLFHVVGLAKVGGTSLSAGDPVKVFKIGSYTLASSDSTFAATDIGKPVFLQSAGAFSTTAPTTVDEAVKQVGVVRTTSSMEIQILSAFVN